MKVPDIYYQMIITLLILALVSLQGNYSLIIQILTAVIIASVLDLFIKKFRTKKYVVPKSAMVSGMLIGSILDPGTNLLVVAFAAVVAILSKHLIRINKKNIFNPAGFGIVFVGMFIHAGSSWWTASNVPLIILLGALILYRIKKIPVALAFAVVYELIFAMNSPALVSSNPSILINPLILFFAAFMLIEHKTSPNTLKAGVVYSVIVALASFVVFLYLPALFKPSFLLIGLLIGNIATALFENTEKPDMLIPTPFNAKHAYN